MVKRAPYQICQPDIIIIAQNNIASRGKAGELGRRRIGTVEFLKYGLCPTKFFAFTFFFLASAGSGNNQLSCSGSGELCAEQA